MTVTGREARRRQKLRHAMEVLLRHKGVVKSAAHELGTTEKTLREWTSEYCANEGFLTLFEAAAALGREGGVKTSV